MEELLICVLCVWMWNGVLSSNGGQPPIIKTYPDAEIAYKELESVDLQCNAEGFPRPTFFWEKDGVQLNVTDEYTQDKNSGKLTIKKTVPALHDGSYQCFAQNEFGVAVTSKTILRKAELHTFPSSVARIHRPNIGEKLTLNCTPPASFPSAIVYWGKSKKGAKLQPIENTDRISLDYSGNLYLSHVAREDYVEENMTYVCIAEQLVLRTLTQGDDCIVRPPDSDAVASSYHRPSLMWSSSTSETAIRGKTTRMKCIFSGLPTPTVTWTRAGSPLPAKVRVTSFGQELEIPDANVSDAGLYFCTGNNTPTGPFISQNFSLRVEAAPFWRHGEPPQDVIASEDDDVEFHCNVDGVPNPKITWTINGRSPSDAEPNDRRSVFDNKIKFSRVQKNDSQVFQCMASNRHGSILSNAYLFVRAEKPSVLESLPKLTKVPEGKKVTLLCRMDGAPKPIITWFYGKTKTPVSGDGFQILPSGDLEITNPTGNDSGMYYCTGRNKFDEETAHGELLVRQKTVITEPPQSQDVNASQRVEFTCRADTDPEELANLNITWYKNDQRLDLSDESAVIVGDKLVIDKVRVSDSGIYKCEAGNTVDSSEATAQLTVRDRPNPPTNILLTRCLAAKAELSWNASEDNNDPVVEYVVYYNASYDPVDGYHVGSRVTQTSAGVTLLPWTNYTFHVTARNGLGTSDRSAFTSGKCTTPETKPHKSPTGVCSRNGKPGELVITWKPMPRSEHHGDGFHYSVKYQRLTVTNDTTGDEVTRQVYHEDELIVENQDIYQGFRFSVLAVNKMGPAPERSAPVHHGYSSEGVPVVSPENFGFDEGSLNGSSVTFSWDPVDDSPELINGYFLGYRVLFWRPSQPDDVRSEDKMINKPLPPCPQVDKRRRHDRSRRSTDRVTLTTHNLWGSASVAAVAVVVNGANTGGRSNQIEFDVPEGVPDMVTSLDIVERGTHHLKLEWTPPLEINGKLTSYYVGYEDSGGKQWESHVDASQTKKKLHKLQPDSAYHIFVEARTATGSGLRRYVDGTTVPLSDALDVPDIEEPEQGENFAVIRWKPSVHPQPKNPGSSFHVEYHLKDYSDRMNKSEAEDQHNWINLTDLVPGKQYRVVVVASNSVGHSSRSEPREFILGRREEPVVHSAKLDLWLIILILVILLLILIILIILCCIRRSRQGKYAVYEKEKLHGCNTDSVNEEPTFGEYTKSAAPTTLQAPNTIGGSLDSIEKPLESDSNSLAEYEETDPTKFNEDGSFIGQYGGQKKEAALDQNAPFATIV